MVERCHRTLQSVITKVMQTQEDWSLLLNSVLFAIRSHTHSSTGFSPIHMLYQKDAIMPFEVEHQNVNGCGDSLVNDTEIEGEDQDQNDPVDEGSCKSDVDEVVLMVEAIEKECKEIFTNAGKQILKVQKHQAECYNRRHSIGTSFEVGMLVLKKNSSKSLSKLTLKYTGPYSIVSKCANGNFKLKNKYSHFLKTSIHPSRLVQFYKDKLHKVNKKGEVDARQCIW